MILSLQVKNFAIIDNIQIDFKKGMTALVGQTGAGKSLIIDAIGLLFGDRASNGLVRFGETKASIEGVFSSYHDKVNEILKLNNIEIDELLILKREVYDNGKSIARINGEIVSLNLLSEVSNYLGSIHNQFDTIKLVNPKNYFTFIDNSEINDLILKYKEKLSLFNKNKKEYNDLKLSLDEKERQLDYLKFQYEELKKAKLSNSEEEDILGRINILSNHEKIVVNFQQFIKLFNDNNIIDNLYEANEFLKKNKVYDESLKENVETIDNIYYTLSDIYENISSICNHDDFDVHELDNLNERLDVYNSLKRKYRLSTEELIKYLDNLEKQINQIENSTEFLDNYYQKMKDSFDETLKLALEISTKRNTLKTIFEEDIRSNLRELQLKDTTLQIVIDENYVTMDDPSGFLSNGINTIDFLVSFNKGEKLKPLAKCASGGELSRFMLAIKSISCDLVKDSLFIFDEIDTGVSGEVALSIGTRIKKIANQNQVLCITHLPIVASIATNQILIEKRVTEENKTITLIKELDYDERVMEIARMLSSGENSASVALAKEMLKQNENSFK